METETPAGRSQILDAASIARTLRRMADEIIERNAAELTRLALIGIHTRGVEVARRLSVAMARSEGRVPEVGELDISMHRDDYRKRDRLTSIQPTKLPGNLDDRVIILVDDVFQTGRTARAAMDALADFGRPPFIQFAALIDRGGRELPIRPDYVGKYSPADPTDRVHVRFENLDGEPDAVWLIKPA